MLKDFAFALVFFLLASPAAASAAEIPYNSELVLSSSGWDHHTKSFDSPCSGPADMQGTPCYGKVPKMIGEFPIKGEYTLVAFKYSCEVYNYDGGCSDGKTCGMHMNYDRKIGSYNVNGGVASMAGVEDGDALNTILFKGSFTQTYQCGACGHGEWVYYTRPTRCKVDVYTQAFASCDAFCSEIHPNSYGEDDRDGGCVCYCNEGYVPVQKEESSGGRDYKKYICASKETSCNSDSDCKVGEVCANGKCVEQGKEFDCPQDREEYEYWKRKYDQEEDENKYVTGWDRAESESYARYMEAEENYELCKQGKKADGKPTTKPPAKKNTMFEDYDPTKGYCGPEAIISVNIKHGSGANFNGACWGHDKCYDECWATGNSRSFCDNKFRADLDKECKDANEINQKECERYFVLDPRRLMCSIWSTLQYSGCQFDSTVLKTAVRTGGWIAYPC